MDEMEVNWITLLPPLTPPLCWLRSLRKRCDRRRSSIPNTDGHYSNFSAQLSFRYGWPSSV